MKGVDVLISGLTRSQSMQRSKIGTVQFDNMHGLIRIHPLATLNRQGVLEYVRENRVPYNALHERGYPSIGCMQCTKSVVTPSIATYSREGRWSDFGLSDCGMNRGAY